MKKLFSLFIFFVYVCPLPSQAQFAKESYDKRKDISDNNDGYTEIQFVGTGDIQLALREGKNTAANTGLGILFWRIWHSNAELQLDAKINVASTVDSLTAFRNNGTISGDRIFGVSLLAPVTNGQGTAVNTLWYLSGENVKNKWMLDGIQVTGLASNTIWQLKSTTTDQATGKDITTATARAASIFFVRAGIFHEFVPEADRRKTGYSIRAGVNYNYRAIQGDLGTPKNDQFRNELLGTTTNNFHGIEFLLSLRLKNIRADASLPIVGRGGISGLYGSQFYTSISFVGGFPLIVK